MPLTIRFGCAQARDGVPLGWWYRIEGWGAVPPEGAGPLDEARYGRDRVTAAWVGLVQALGWVESVGGLDRAEPLRLETAERAVADQLRGECGATDHHAKALVVVKETLKRLRPARCSIHPVPGGTPDAQSAEGPAPGKAVPAEAGPTPADREAEIDRILALMERGLSSCCEAPIDTSRVIDRPGHRHHGHGPRTCSKCGGFLFVV